MGKCQKCKKDFQAGVKAAYALGVIEGQVQLNRMRATNKALLKELKYKDKVCPLSDCRVWLGRDYAERLVRSFQVLRNYHRSRQLQKIIDKQIKPFVDIDNSTGLAP